MTAQESGEVVIRAVVVDDEPLARRRLARLLGEHEDVQLVGEAGSADEAVALVLAELPDALFLDVNMPGRTGLEALQEMRAALAEDQRPLVVFTTAHEEHAIPAFELEGTDYLLKPVEAAHVERALGRVRRRLAARAAAGEAAAPVQPEAPAPQPVLSGHLAARQAGRVVMLAAADIGALSVTDELTWAHTREGQLHVPCSLGEALARLPSPPFVQASRSAVVNIAWIAHLSPGASGTWRAELKPPLRLEVQVSRRRARELRELLGW